LTSTGIGAAICENLAAKGCNLVMNYTSASSEEKTKALASQLEESTDIKTLIVQADLGSENGPSYVVETTKNHFAHPKSGKFQIDIVINNAGVSVNRQIEDCDAEDFAWQYNVNVRGPLLLMKAVLPYLPHDRSGRIVNLSSVSSSLGFIAQSVYGGTKAALEAMTRTWARELAERATVNAVNPGPVATDMYGGTSPEFQARMANFIRTAPLMKERPGVDPKEFVDDAEASGGRPGYDFEVAGVVGMLCSSESGWCTGSVVCANGGMRFSP
jgi:NAD(P)-dependent dehydrogenase (short-subunit alcohol dehydrogenase family)